MNWKRMIRTVLYPPMAIMLVLLPFATVYLIYSMIYVGTKTIAAYVSYGLATYTLIIWCLKIPDLIRFMKSFKTENRYARRWFSDTFLRVNVSLYGSLLWNTAYGVFLLGLGFYHETFWFYSMAAYYISLAIMRFFLVQHVRKHKPKERMKEELVRYRACGIIFLVMNLFLSLMIFFMIYWNRTFYHHEITTISMAAYTFASLTLAIMNVIKYRRYESPIYSASKAIGLAAACVSMLTLECTMLTTFDDGSMTLLQRRILIGSSGAVISAFIIGMAIYMIVQSNKKLKKAVDTNKTKE